MKVNNETFIKAIAEHKSDSQMSDYLGITFYQIAIQAKQKSNYNHVAHDVDMIADAVLECHEKIGSFNPEKSANPHAYFMRVCLNNFHDTVAKNTEHNYIVGGVMDEFGVSTTASQEFMVDYLERNPIHVYASGKDGNAAGESYNWIHKDGRTFTGIVTELRNAFPEENLDRSTLSKVTKGTEKAHKGWSIIK